MSDLALTTANASQQAAIKPQRDKSATITGKVREALHAMVWDGLPRKHAAEKAGISEHGLYKALRKPNVKQLYLSELEVLRTSERARNIHRLTEIRDKADNMPAVNAIKMLEQLGDTDGPGSAARTSPGLVIVIQGAATHAPQAANPVQVIDNTEEER